MIEKAIAVYLDNSDKIEEEFSWLYKTWLLYSLDKEFDLVVYYSPDAKDRLEKYTGIKPVEMGAVRYSNVYKFLKSHYFCLPDYNEPLKKYKYLLKTDCDVFLTKNIKGFKPSKIMIGQGGFYDQSDEKKVNFIKNIAKELNLSYSNMTGIGASFFGKTELILNLVKTQIYLTEYLLLNCFKNKDGIDEDSGFHVGISSMIGGELAVNAMFANQHINLYSMDSKCWESTKIGTDVIHIHAWHSYQSWSKHSYFAGEYKDKIVNFEDAFDNASNYCHWVATTPLDKILKIRSII